MTTKRPSISAFFPAYNDGGTIGSLVVTTLNTLAELTDDFQAPEWACGSYRTLFAELRHLHGDILRHVHLENHVLAPRFA